jgi:DNA-binding transcriptional MerR regulator
MSTLHQLAIGLGISEKTLLSWNKNFKILPLVDENGQKIYSDTQKALILRVHHLIKERGFTLAGAKKELAKPDQRARRAQTIAELTEIKQFLQALKANLGD